MKKVSLFIFLLFSLYYSGIAQSTTFTATGSIVSYTVPAGVTEILISASGAQGGNSTSTPQSGGQGAIMSGVFTVTPGDVLNILVGEQPDAVVNNAGGGGGSFVWDVTAGNTLLIAAGGGGGAVSGFPPGSDGIDASTGTSGVAGGGGGGTGFGTGGNGATAPGNIYYGGGGAGWNTNGNNGATAIACTNAATGGTTPMGGGAGGAYGGIIGFNGNGGYGGGGGGQGLCSGSGGGGGGGGYSGGAAGAVSSFSTEQPGGGGGSYNGGTNQSNSVGNTGPGVVTLCPLPNPGSITDPDPLDVCAGINTTLSDTAEGGGGAWSTLNTAIGTISPSGVFTSVDTNRFLPDTVTVVYTVTNGCGSSMATVVVTANPTPFVYPVSAPPALCNGSPTTMIVFSGSVPGTFNWTNSNSTIGLAAFGSGDTINSFTAIDSSATAYNSAIVIVGETSTAGCTGGGTSTFTFYVYPIPTITSQLIMPPICDGSTFAYVPMDTVVTATYTWSRAAVPGISNPTNGGSGDAIEMLDDTTGNTMPETVVYNYIATAGVCHDTVNVSVVVNPYPVLSNVTVPGSICSGSLFTYIDSTATPNTNITWSRGLESGISNPANSGRDTIMETLNDTITSPVTVTYYDTLAAAGCVTIEPLMVIVNPMPMLTSSLMIPAVCSGSNIMYVATDTSLSGTTFSWTSNSLNGYTGSTDVLSDTINQTVVNTDSLTDTIDYTFMLMSSAGCADTQVVMAPVYPIPVLTSTLTPPGICDSTQFNYTPRSSTPSATFAWSRPFVLGIGNPANSGTGNPGEYLINNTNDNSTNAEVTYVYTVTANGCSSNPYDVVVDVHPRPTLSSPLTWSACTGTPVDYIAAGYVFGTAFAYKRAEATGINASAGSGGDTVSESLTDTMTTPVAVVYVYTLTANGCSNAEDVTVTINPSPASLAITLYPGSTLCDNTMYQNFGVAAPPPSGQGYTWTATNATISKIGSTGQYCLVSFDNPGTAVITMESSYNEYSCKTNNSYTVTVGSTMSDIPPVTYYQGQFLCLQPDETHYQWGYDDASTLAPTTLTGENNPNYINMSPDFDHNYYWVETTDSGGCTQKTYAAGVTGGGLRTAASLSVYPNPANGQLNVEVVGGTTANYEIHVVNMLGQQLISTVSQEANAAINVAMLPAGCYLVECWRDGNKVGIARFIKN